ncbi:WSC domain-containing protein [Stachybotrys elegans]|uniref:WSC domain-containing protein n=1 Tax=Stachybotrys elegans TaxID=80388 RepID=A0A8K0WTU9_9HYPO|nr:WSC domain-containing protein [Stachybotrys elegans]
MKSIFSLSATAACLVVLFTAPRRCAAGIMPNLEWDPDTVSPCAYWEDNGYGRSCEDIRNEYNITAEEFSAWNPSLDINCKPWRYQAYCVVPLSRLPTLTSTSTVASTTITPTTTTSEAPTLGPSPTSWALLGCYSDEDPALPVLESRISSGDTALTYTKCQETCYQAFLTYAGVKAGNECWCSSFVGGELAVNGPSDCNMPCTGNKTDMCGGKNRLTIFEPIGFVEEEEEPSEDAGAEEGDDAAAVSESSGRVNTAEDITQVSGAGRSYILH